MSENENLNDDAWDESEEGDEELDAEGEAAEGADAEARRASRDDDYEPQDDRARMALKFVTDVIREMEMECRVRLRCL
jgi:hypothetical protein